MSRGPNVTVAGAGALGLSAALALAKAGCTVSVCDPARGAQASAVAAGMLAPVFEAILEPTGARDLGLLLAARNLWPDLAVRTGITIERSGTAAVGCQDWLAVIRTQLARHGMLGSELPRKMLESLVPGLAGNLDGLLLREDWRLEPRAALLALRRAAEGEGVTFKSEAMVERGRADWLVVATGAGQDLVSVAPELRELRPIKGQILRFMDRRGGRISVRADGAYAVPGSDGLAIGATMEPGRNDTTIDPVTLRPLIEAAGRLFPDLAQAAFDVSAGVRAATPDGLPMVGLSQTPNVILAVGARRNGWLLAPLAAQIVTACVVGSDSGPYARQLEPSRFKGVSGETGRAQ